MGDHPPSPVVYCPHCDRNVAGVEQWNRVFGEEPSALRFTVLLCPRCENPFLVKAKGWVDSCEDHQGYCVFYDDKETEVLYPADVSVDPVVPKPIADSCLEAHRVFNVGAYTSAAIMCRRTLEGICAHRKAKGRTLEQKLIDLKSKGIIEPKVYGWADNVLRSLGNNAAHDVNQTISKEDARDALEFTKAILEYLYVFEAAFEKFKRRQKPRRKKRKKKVTKKVNRKGSTDIPRLPPG